MNTFPPIEGSISSDADVHSVTAFKKFENQLWPDMNDRKMTGYTGHSTIAENDRRIARPQSASPIDSATVGYRGYYEGKSARPKIGKIEMFRPHSSKSLHGADTPVTELTLSSNASDYNFESSAPVSPATVASFWSPNTSKKSIQGYTGCQLKGDIVPDEGTLEEFPAIADARTVKPILGYSGWYRGRGHGKLEKIQKHHSSISLYDKDSGGQLNTDEQYLEKSITNKPRPVSAYSSTSRRTVGNGSGRNSSSDGSTSRFFSASRGAMGEGNCSPLSRTNGPSSPLSC